MRRVFWIIGILAVLVGGFFAYRAYSSARSAQAAQENMQTLALEEGTLAATIGATGTVQANQSANLGWQTSGTIDQVNVLLGDEVTKDQELADLAQTSLAQNVIQDIYHNKSEKIVAFICAEYNQKEWCGLEWRAIRDLIKKGKDDDIIFVRIGPGDVKGHFSIDGYLDANKYDYNEISDFILQRI